MHFYGRHSISIEPETERHYARTVCPSEHVFESPRTNLSFALPLGLIRHYRASKAEMIVYTVQIAGVRIGEPVQLEGAMTQEQ